MFSLQWILQSWVSEIQEHPETQKAFLEMRIADLLESPWDLVGRPFSRELPVDKQLELASGTVMAGQKISGRLQKEALNPKNVSLMKRASDAVEAVLGPSVRHRIGAISAVGGDTS